MGKQKKSASKLLGEFEQMNREASATMAKRDHKRESNSENKQRQEDVENHNCPYLSLLSTQRENNEESFK